MLTAARARLSETTHHRIANGVVEVAVTRADWPLDQLCDFAARRNARRGLLVVSRVLGRHLPARPSIMRAASDALAARLPDDLPGPVVFVALAETAVCLGNSVFEGWLASTGRRDGVCLQSTRQRADAPLLARFSEPHSHAPEHLIHTPGPEAAERLASARTLVLVDDEITTGTTLANLAQALSPAMPSLERTVFACLTDWSAGQGAERVSLLQGALLWRPDSDIASDPLLEGASGLGCAPPGGLGHRGRVDGELHLSGLLAAVQANGDCRPVLVLGLGEFSHPPFRLGEALERAGLDVQVQTASRSPIRLGGPIHSVLPFRDPYGSAATHHVYNAPRPGERRVLICHETPAASVDRALIEALDAELVAFPPERGP